MLFNYIYRKGWCHTSFISPQFRNSWELLTSTELLQEWGISLCMAFLDSAVEFISPHFRCLQCR